MTFNYTSEKRKFDNAWAKLAQTYAEAGMTPEAIQEMYEYDWSVFKANRIEAIHSQGIHYTAFRSAVKKARSEKDPFSRSSA